MLLDSRTGRYALRTAVAALTLAVAAAGAPREAQATNGRVWTLGSMNRFVLDDANRWLFPHAITKFGNLFYLELYGLGPSIGANAPDSLRGDNDRSPLQTLDGAYAMAEAFVTGGALTSVEVMPVQATAGGGAILSLTDDLFISLHLTDYENPIVKAFIEGPVARFGGGDPSAYGWVTSGNIEAISAANRKFDLGLAYNLQDVASFGLLLTYGSSKYNRNPNDNDPVIFQDDEDEQVRLRDNIGTSEFRFLLGTGLDLGDSLAIDVGFGMGFHSLTYEPNARVDLIDGGGGIDVQGDIRAFIGLTEWWELVPAFSFRYGSLAAADLSNLGSGRFYNDRNSADRSRTNITDSKISWMTVDVGVAGHMKPTDYIDFWIAAGYQLFKANSQFDHFIPDNPPGNNVRPEDVVTRDDTLLEFASDRISGDAFPYLRLAIEARVFSWLDLRAGVVKFLRADTQLEEKLDETSNQNNKSNDFTQDFPFFDYFVGFAAHYEGFFLDMQVDPNWFRRGPYLASGAGGPMFINGSLGYKF